MHARARARACVCVCKHRGGSPADELPRSFIGLPVIMIMPRGARGPPKSRKGKDASPLVFCTAPLDGQFSACEGQKHSRARTAVGGLTDTYPSREKKIIRFVKPKNNTNKQTQI